jgi:hypothetical protein
VFTDVLRDIYDGVDETKLQVQLGNTRYDPKDEKRLTGLFLQQKPLAMIVVDQTAKSRRMLETAGRPVTKPSAAQWPAIRIQEIGGRTLCFAEIRSVIGRATHDE